MSTKRWGETAGNGRRLITLVRRKNDWDISCVRKWLQVTNKKKMVRCSRWLTAQNTSHWKGCSITAFIRGLLAWWMTWDLLYCSRNQIQSIRGSELPRTAWTRLVWHHNTHVTMSYLQQLPRRHAKGSAAIKPKTWDAESDSRQPALLFFITEHDMLIFLG